VINPFGAAQAEASFFPADRRYAFTVYSPKRPRRIDVDRKRLARRKSEVEAGWSCRQPFVIVDGLRQPRISLRLLLRWLSAGWRNTASFAMACAALAPR
jgi:hypothetical protein